ncbi:MAG: major capsid protein, partial [Armatimonadetes bacterium]|nr:major capsid protein [Armatimonadota bacterium]
GGTTSDPVNDIRNWKMTNIQLSGVTPDTLILGEDAAAAFLSDDQVKALLDVRNMMVGQVNVQDLPNGAEYIGTIVGVDIFAYPEWYIDDDTGVETPMIAASHAILFASAARSPESAIFYGAYYDVAKQQTLVGSRIPRSWVDVGANMEFYEVLSFPVPYVPDSDSWLVATVV